MSTAALVGLGSNCGDRFDHLCRARRALSGFPDTWVAGASSIYATDPVGDRSQPGYLNAAVRLVTGLAPRRLLERLLALEAERGRPASGRWRARTVDLDLLAYGREVIEEPPDLVVPHPRMAWRGFVLVPVSELEPDWRHPRLGVTVWGLLRAFADLSTVRPVAAPQRWDPATGAGKTP
jgi:2-amino-4-hydroxy-6-hydroxymethyldihydropteridine diphosphokinase